MKGVLGFLFIVFGIPLRAQTLSDNSQTDPFSERQRAWATQPFAPIDTGVVLSKPRSQDSAISRARLTHKPPKAAKSEFEKGIRAKNSGHVDQAMGHFVEAVRLDPAFWEALAALADVYWIKNDPSNALIYLDLALAIDPNSEVLQSNKTVALLDLGRPVEAEASARRAVQVAPRSETGHYLLGLALLRQDRLTSETATHFALALKYPYAKEAYIRIQQHLTAVDQLP